MLTYVVTTQDPQPGKGSRRGTIRKWAVVAENAAEANKLALAGAFVGAVVVSTFGVSAGTAFEVSAG